MAVVVSGVRKIKTVPAQEPMPQVFELDDHERFTDMMGDHVAVEVRGERAHDKLWFRASDVEGMIEAAGFSEADYEKGLHIHVFEKGGKRASVSTPFLTYCGLLKAMFMSGNPLALRFQRWAAKRLFILHFGTREDKTDLTAEMLGMPVAMLKSFIHANFSTLQMSKMHDLEAQLAHEKKIGQQLRQQLEIQDSHRKEMFAMMNTIIQEKSAMVEEKNQRIKEMAGMLDMYRSIQIHDINNEDS